MWNMLFKFLENHNRNANLFVSLFKSSVRIFISFPSMFCNFYLNPFAYITIIFHTTCSKTFYSHIKFVLYVIKSNHILSQHVYWKPPINISYISFDHHIFTRHLGAAIEIKYDFLNQTPCTLFKISPKVTHNVRHI